MEKFAVFFSLSLIILSVGISPAPGSEKESPVRVFYERSPAGGYDIFASNSEVIPMTVKVDLPLLERMTPTEKVPFFKVVPPGTEKLFILGVRPNGEDPHFRYRFHYYWGNCIEGKHDDSHVYLIPFAHGTKHLLSQGYRGNRTHVGNNAYAVDFNMPEGTEIYAARGGVVFRVKEDSDIGGPDASYGKHGNYIHIYHDDGTFSRYIHLKKDGALVEKGDRVRTGDLIGHSGNTGRSRSPHLHFQVEKYRIEGGMVTVPTRFLDHDGKAVTLECATWYYATHPGKGEYPVRLGRNLSDNDFLGHAEPIDESGRIEVRQERLDDTFVLFARNGLSVPCEVKARFTLDNMVSTRGNPVTVTVPPGNEAYLCIVRKRKPADPSDWEFSFRFRYAYTYRKLRQ